MHRSCLHENFKVISFGLLSFANLVPANVLHTHTKEVLKSFTQAHIRQTNNSNLISMIARIWKGKTKIEHLEEYTAFMKARAIPDYQNTDGFIKLTFLKRTDTKFAYFNLMTFWKNLEVIKNFAGTDFEKAKYYPEDQNYLIDFPDKVTHYVVFAE